MSTIHLNETTTATPEQLVAGLTDFGPGRSELFARSADQYLEVHDQGPGRADVTEGSGQHLGTPALRLVRSQPRRHVNLWGGDSGHTYTFMRKPDGTTDLDVVVVRSGKNIRGRALGLLLAIVGKRAFEKDLGKTIKAIEARNGGARHEHHD